MGPAHKLITATAVSNNMSLATLNRKHFDRIKNKTKSTKSNAQQLYLHKVWP